MTLVEIARLAKVSTATVSRAINRVPSVNPVLARRIRKIIEKHGYYPNTNARALVRGHSRSLGLIVSEITNPFFPEIVQTFSKLAVQLNYEILLSSIDHDPRLLQITARQMIERRVGGVAILTFSDEAPLINMLTAGNVSVFAVNADLDGPLVKTFQIDYEHGIRQAVQHLAALGHRRIAFIGGPRKLKTATMRKSAVEKCLKEIDLGASSGTVRRWGSHDRSRYKGSVRSHCQARSPLGRALFKRHDGHRRNASGIRPFSQYSARLVGHRVR